MTGFGYNINGFGVGQSAAPIPDGGHLFDDPGTHTWTAPEDVTKVSAVCIGGLTTSYFILAATVSGVGGSVSGNGYTGDGGGNGGAGGAFGVNAEGSYAGGGGGGAGGYTGAGGAGGAAYGDNVSSGHSFGAGGGGTGVYGAGSSGASSGYYSTQSSTEGAAGSGGGGGGGCGSYAAQNNAWRNLGKGGSGGGDGGAGCYYGSFACRGGGKYGGGGGELTSSGGMGGGGLGWKNDISVTPGNDYTVVVGTQAQTGNSGTHYGGAVRLIWGIGRAFPSTSVTKDYGGESEGDN